MSYQVLARKWRPRNFKEMAGQGHVLKTLVNALDNERLHHAYLFTGTRGVGKTTIARILAKCLNCEKGVSSEPCGECSACVEIDEGRFIDLIEVDAASRTKVEDTRELLDNVQYAPSRGRYKVYLIDEVHMLSGHSFNALLKTLEEPPPHVKFLLATTDPQKLPITVLSRCLQFNLKNLNPEIIMQHLKFILEQENIDFEEDALWQIGRAAKGSVRDALTLLDQAISYADGKITDAEVSSFLGTIDQSVLYKLVDALAAEDAAALLDTIHQAAEQAPDFGSILEALLSYLHRVAIAQVLPEGLDNSEGDRKQVLAHAQAMPAETVQLYYQIALKGREDLPLALDERAGIEMTLLRMLAFTPHGVPGRPNVPLAGSDQGVGPGNEKPESGQAQAESEESGRHNEKKKRLETLEVKDVPLEPASASLQSEDVPPEKPVPQEAQAPGAATKPKTESSPVAKTEIKSELPARESLTEPVNEKDEPEAAKSDERRLPLADLSPEHWISVFYGLEISGITRNIAANCQLQSAEGNRLAFALDESQAKIFEDKHREQINAALNRYFDTGIELSIEKKELDPAYETPAAFRLRKQQERQHIAEETFRNDENVKTLVERFEGVILPDTIEPLTPEDY